MLLIHLLLSAFLAQIASAFYPEYPEWKCVQDGRCMGLDKREASVEEDVADAFNEIFTLKIRQHVPKSDVPHDVRVARYADRLEKKFKARTLQSDNTASLIKRANTYSIVSSTPPTQSYSAAIDQDGTDFSYIAIAEFGSGATKLYMLLDTGAQTTWVMGSGCQSAACSSHNSFGPTDSKTFQASNTPFSIGYGTGTVSGTYASDTIAFAGLSLNLTFGVASTTSDDFSHFPMDGILGLSQASGTTPAPFLQVLTGSKALPSNIFGVNLDRNADGTHDGEINFGAADTSKFTGSLSYTPTSSKGGNWVIPVSDMSYNGKSAGVLGKQAVIDTGTTFIFIPPSDAKSLYALIDGAQLSSDGSSYSVPCSTTNVVQFAFSGVTYTVPASDWIGGKSGSLCTSNIYPRDATGMGNWLLGDVFLKNVYTVFDADQSRIGFGIKSASAASSTSSSAASSSTSSATSATSTSSSSLAPSTSVTSGFTSSNTATTVSSSTIRGTNSTASMTTSSFSTSSPPPAAQGFNAAVTSTTATPTAAPEASNSASTSLSASPSPTKQNSAGRLEISVVFIVAGTLGLLTLV